LANTGYMVRTVKQIGGGDTAQVVEEFAVDTGLLRELREIEEQAAIECGDWVEKKEPTHEDTTASAQAGRPELRALGPERPQVLIQMFRDAEKENASSSPGPWVASCSP